MSKPKPFGVGRIRVRVTRGPKAGRWYWRAEFRQDGQRKTVWTGWGTREEVERAVIAVAADGEPRRREPSLLRTVGDLLDFWVGAIEERADLKHVTKVGYRATAERVAGTWLAEVLVGRVNRRVLERYRDARFRQVSPRTVHHEMIRLRAAWSWAREVGLLDAAELPKVRVRVPDTDPYTPTLSEILAVLEWLRDAPRTRAWSRPEWVWRVVWLAYATGCRRGELADIRWRDVDLERGVVRVDGKTGPRSVPLHPDAVEQVRSWQDSAEDRRPDSSIWGVTPGTVRAQTHVHLAAAVDALGQPVWTLRGLRRFAVDQLYSGRVDPAVAAAILGHSAKTAITFYRQVRAPDAASAAEQVGLGRLPRGEVVQMRRAHNGSAQLPDEPEGD